MSAGDKVSVIVAIRPGLKPWVEENWRRAWAPGQEPLELLVAEGRSPSLQRNQAAAQAKGAILYFLDDECRPEPAAPALLEQHFANSSVQAVGGPDLALFDPSPLPKAADFVQASWLGSGPVRDRYKTGPQAKEASEKNLILCNLAIRAETFSKLGGFNTALYPNEENEFLNRLAGKGSRLIWDPALASRRPRPGTWLALAKQSWGYGRGRAWQFKILPTIGDLPHFLPLAALSLGIVGWILQPMWAWTATSLVLLLSMLEYFRARASGLGIAASSVPIVLLQRHLAYAVGSLAGFLTRPPSRDTDVKIREGSRA